MNLAGMASVFTRNPWRLTVLVLVLTVMGTCSEIGDYFGGEMKDDLTKIRWAHAVNDLNELPTIINSGVQFIESDVSFVKEEGNHSRVIMAHPPVLSGPPFDYFLLSFYHGKQAAKLGLKLDFKNLNAVKPVLKYLHETGTKENKFPIIINADIFQGPVNASTLPLNATKFISEYKEFVNKTAKKFKPIILSVGWTTRFGKDDDRHNVSKSGKEINTGKYSSKNFDEAKITLRKTGVLKLKHSYITFPLRAGLAVHSTSEILDLLKFVGSTATITLWSPEDDSVNLTLVNDLIGKIGKDKCFLDLPREMLEKLEEIRKSPVTATPSTTTNLPSTSIKTNSTTTTTTISTSSQLPSTTPNATSFGGSNATNTTTTIATPATKSISTGVKGKTENGTNVTEAIKKKSNDKPGNKHGKKQKYEPKAMLPVATSVENPGKTHGKTGGCASVLGGLMSAAIPALALLL